MRIVFFGATDLGFQCCRQLLETGEEVVGIFTIPQQFNISYSPTPVRNVTFRNFEILAEAHDIPLVHVTTKMSDAHYVDVLQRWQPDFGLVIGWYYMVPRTVRDLFTKGVAGIHASLLPKYRGGAPLVWAIINGESKTGVTLFYFDGGVDTGDIIAQQEIAITARDTIKTVYQRASDASLEILRRYMPMISQDTAPRIQQDHEAATQFPQRKPEDGLIAWKSKYAKQVYDWIRAQTRPYPGAFTYFGEEKVTIWQAHLSGTFGDGMVAGSVLKEVTGAPNSFGVVCADGELLLIDEIGLGDGIIMSGAEFVKARDIGPDRVLGQ